MIPAGLVAASITAAVYLLWLRPAARTLNFEITPSQNVLLVTIDTLRADALGAYGGKAATPNLDRLAEEGVRFTLAHAHAVMTLPSHASILSGRFPYQHGARDNAGFRVAESVRTLAEMARDKGFATGAFVGAFPLDRQFGLAQGFNVYDDLAGQEVAPADFLFTERPAGDVVAAAMKWITGQQQPWLAWVHVFDPHAPYAAPQAFQSQYPDPYAGEVAYTDHALGPLLDLARASSRPTTVIVTADHGEGLGDHGEATHGIFAYESTLRVPLILAQLAPAVRARRGSGLVVETPVRHVDILPTIAALTGLAIDEDLPGRSLLSTWRGDTDDRPSYFEAMTAMLKRGWAPLRGVIVGGTKYIELPIEEMYDLRADAGERQNLVAATPDRVRQLVSHLRSLNAPLPGEQAAENAEVRARLQSLGYLSGSVPRKAQYGPEDDPKRLVDVDRLMMQGIELHRGRRTAEAIAAYRQVIARRPDMMLAYRRLAYIQYEAGATGEAIATLREALARNGPDLEAEIRLGTYLAETGRPDQALPILEKVTAADPENTEGANALGIAYARSGRVADAQRVFTAILGKDPINAFALENLGAVHMQRGDLPAAREAFERAVKVSPRSSRAHAGLGAVASYQRQDAQAILHWQQAVALDGSNFDALFNLASALIRTGRAGEARPYAERFVQTAPPAFYGKDIEAFRRFLRTPGGRP
jgi:arylsulfatase A-like enzyme/Flp pilus assembly protein TadD